MAPWVESAALAADVPKGDGGVLVIGVFCEEDVGECATVGADAEIDALSESGYGEFVVGVCGGGAVRTGWLDG